MQENTNIAPPSLSTNVGKKQTYYYRSISPTQIAGLADAILEKVFGFEQVPDMVTLTANKQGHFDFKAQFMYEDSIPFPQKRSTASKEKEKQKVKDIALAFFRTANEKVKANKQPKLENQDYRPMFQDRDVDRGSFPSDFPDLFPIQYLEWQSTEPIFHAEYPKNIHYYEVRFRVELPVIAAGRFDSAQRPIIETPKTETVQNPETPVARLSSNAPTNHAPQTQKLVDTFLGNATQTPTVKATVQNEYIVLHINPDDKRYEIMGVESCFVQIAGQEITDLLEMAGENIGLYFLQEGNLKVPYWTAEGKVAATMLNVLNYNQESPSSRDDNDENLFGKVFSDDYSIEEDTPPNYYYAIWDTSLNECVYLFDTAETLVYRNQVTISIPQEGINYCNTSTYAITEDIKAKLSNAIRAYKYIKTTKSQLAQNIITGLESANDIFLIGIGAAEAGSTGASYSFKERNALEWLSNNYKERFFVPEVTGYKSEKEGGTFFKEPAYNVNPAIVGWNPYAAGMVYQKGNQLKTDSSDITIPALALAHELTHAWILFFNKGKLKRESYDYKKFVLDKATKDLATIPFANFKVSYKVQNPNDPTKPLEKMLTFYFVQREVGISLSTPMAVSKTNPEGNIIQQPLFRTYLTKGFIQLGDTDVFTFLSPTPTNVIDANTLKSRHINREDMPDYMNPKEKTDFLNMKDIATEQFYEKDTPIRRAIYEQMKELYTNYFGSIVENMRWGEYICMTAQNEFAKGLGLVEINHYDKNRAKRIIVKNSTSDLQKDYYDYSHE